MKAASATLNLPAFPPRPPAAALARTAVYGLLAVASSSLQAQSADYVLPIVNRLRAPGGACAAAAPPLAPRDMLDAAASRVAQGAPLDAAFKAAGYRMAQAQVITVSGQGLRAGLEKMLAQRFCAQLGNTKLTDIGVYERRNQLWIVLAAPFTPQVGLTRQQVAERMLALVNQARAGARRCGDKAFGAAPALAWNATLESAAAQHASDMATQDYFNHTARDGSNPAQRVTRAGYRYRATGENLASGQLSPEDAVAGWLKSPGHCANMMNATYSAMGVAFAVNPASTMGVYWVQLFGAPR